jgi:hypothetical protein
LIVSVHATPAAAVSAAPPFTFFTLRLYRKRRKNASI